MNGFEKYLMAIGYVKHIYDCKKGELVKVMGDKHVISTLVNLDHRYIKDGRQIIFGLNEANKPPTLIHPRPKIIFKRGNEILTQEWDDAMIMALKQHEPSEIYEAIFNPSHTIYI